MVGVEEEEECSYGFDELLKLPRSLGLLLGLGRVGPCDPHLPCGIRGKVGGREGHLLPEREFEIRHC